MRRTYVRLKKLPKNLTQTGNVACFLSNYNKCAKNSTANINVIIDAFCILWYTCGI